MPRVVLAGPDFVEPGSVEVTALGTDTAVGICRGWEPKPYRYLDPNEDVAAVASGPRGTLLVVADGHSGHESSLAAVRHVMEVLGDDPPPADLADEELVGLFLGAQRAIVESVLALPSPRSESATTLVVALVTPGRVQWATLGDSVALLVGRRRSRLLTAPTRQFVGQPFGDGLRHLVGRGSVGTEPGDWLVLATDGYTDWAPTGGDLARATALWTAGSDAAATVVHRLMDKARAGGAGDNVALAVTRA